MDPKREEPTGEFPPAPKKKRLSQGTAGTVTCCMCMDLLSRRCPHSIDLHAVKGEAPTLLSVLVHMRHCMAEVDSVWLYSSSSHAGILTL